VIELIKFLAFMRHGLITMKQISKTLKWSIALLTIFIGFMPCGAQAETPLGIKQKSSLITGYTFRDCPTCPEMVVVPAGLFIMGSNGKRKAERPAHRVNITAPFAVGRYEVTFDQWHACLKDKACTHKPDDHNWGANSRPVINVTWHQVHIYLLWLSRKTGHIYRLPSEAEWEYVNRAGTTSNFWWGNEPGKNNANCKDCKSQWSAKSSAPVGSFQPNPFGLFDTVGNVFEWVSDCWNPDHEGAENTTAPRTTGVCEFRVIRGGSFYYFNKVSRASYRAKNRPGVKSYWLGFRVVRELP
jgi:formylglycine-generating enzyme required for sulfatase activity